MPPALPSLLSLLILAASAASTQWDSLSPVTINYDSSLSSSEGIVLTGGGITVTFSAVADGTQPYLDGTGAESENSCSPSDSQCPNGVSFQGSKLYLSDFERNECAVQLTASQPIAQFSMTDLDGFDRNAGANKPKDFMCCSVAGHWTGFVGSLGSYDASTGLARDGLGDPASDDGSGLSEARDRSRNSSLAPGDGARVRAPPADRLLREGRRVSAFTATSRTAWEEAVFLVADLMGSSLKSRERTLSDAGWARPTTVRPRLSQTSPSRNWSCFMRTPVSLSSVAISRSLPRG